MEKQLLESINDWKLQESYRKYIAEMDNGLTFEEYKESEVAMGLIEAYREFESTGKKALKYGATTIPTLGIPNLLTVALYIYRRLTDTCRKKCDDAPNNKRCYYSCYSTAAKKACAEAFKAGKKAAAKNPDKKEKIMKKAQAAAAKWNKKAEMYAQKAAKAG